MILKDDLYTITAFTETDGQIHSAIRLNPQHRIFEGHFPGQPVLPGVCMVQIIKELVETATGKTWTMSQSDYLKFLSPIIPADGQTIEATVTMKQKEHDELFVTGTLLCDERVCFKSKATFTVD